MEKKIGPLIEHLQEVLNRTGREIAVARKEVALMRQRLSYQESRGGKEGGDDRDDGVKKREWTQCEWRMKGRCFCDPDGDTESLVPPEPEPATEAQISLLDKEGVDYPPQLTSSQADQMIEALWYHQGD